jgi:hypothetical protein
VMAFELPVCAVAVPTAITAIEIATPGIPSRRNQRRLPRNDTSCSFSAWMLHATSALTKTTVLIDIGRAHVSDALVPARGLDGAAGGTPLPEAMGAYPHGSGRLAAHVRPRVVPHDRAGATGGTVRSPGTTPIDGATHPEYGAGCPRDPDASGPD